MDLFVSSKKKTRTAMLIDHDDQEQTLTAHILSLVVQSQPDTVITWLGTGENTPTQKLQENFNIKLVIHPDDLKISSPHICLVYNDHASIHNVAFHNKLQNKVFVIYRSKVHTLDQLFTFKRLHLKHKDDYTLMQHLNYLQYIGQRITHIQMNNHRMEMNHTYVLMEMDRLDDWSRVVRLFQRLIMSPLSMTRITCSSVFLTNFLMEQCLEMIKQKYVESGGLLVVVVPDQCPNEHSTWSYMKRKNQDRQFEKCPSISGDMILKETFPHLLEIVDEIQMLERHHWPSHYIEQIHEEFGTLVREWSHRSFKFDHDEMKITKRNSSYSNQLTREALEEKIPGIYVLQETVAFHHCELLSGVEIVQCLPMFQNENPNLYCCRFVPRTVYGFHEMKLSFPPFIDENMFHTVLFQLQLRDVIAVWWNIIGGWDGFLHYVCASDGLLMEYVPSFINQNPQSLDSNWIHLIKESLREQRDLDLDPWHFLLNNANARSIVIPHVANKCHKSIRQGRIGAKCFMVVFKWFQNKERITTLPPLIPLQWNRQTKMYFPTNTQHLETKWNLGQDLSSLVMNYVHSQTKAKCNYTDLLQEIGFLSMKGSNVKVSYGCTSINRYQSRAQLLDPKHISIFHQQLLNELYLYN